MEISPHHAMAKRPGVSATFHFIAVKDQHCLLYNVIRLDASIFLFASAFLYFCYYTWHFKEFQVFISQNSFYSFWILVLLFLYYYRRNSSKYKKSFHTLYKYKQKTQEEIPWVFLYQLRLLNDSSNYTVTYCTSTFTNREFSSLFDSDWSDKFDSHFDVVTRHYHFSTFW